MSCCKTHTHVTHSHRISTHRFSSWTQCPAVPSQESHKHTHCSCEQLADMCAACSVQGRGRMPLFQLSNGCPVYCTHSDRQTVACPPEDEFLLCLGKRMWSHSLKMQPMSLATHDLIQASLCAERPPLLFSPHALSRSVCLFIYVFTTNDDSL